MRIALAGDWFLPRLGGIELQVRDLALQLRARGHEVTVITSVPGASRVDGIPVQRLGGARIPGAEIACTATAFRELRATLAAGRYDVVHVHFGIVAPVSWGAASCANALGIPCVATFHSVMTHFGAPLRALRAVLGVDAWNVRWSAVSRVAAATMRPLVGDAPVAILPNGIDAEWWARPAPHGPRDGALRVVSVLRLHRRKRPRFLLRAVAHTLAQLPPGRTLQLQVIGDGPDRRLLERSIADGGLRDSVTLRGWLPREEVRRALHEADVFLLPSRLEAFGIAALEARCAGVPVIAMAGSGVQDFLHDGRDALLARDDAGFMRHLTDFASNAPLAAALSAGAAAPPPLAGWPAVVDGVESLYHEAIRGRERASTPSASSRHHVMVTP